MVVFCLALMGTNITQFIQEAHRVLAAEGVLWISEVGMGLHPTFYRLSSLSLS